MQIGDRYIFNNKRSGKNQNETFPSGHEVEIVTINGSQTAAKFVNPTGSTAEFSFAVDPNELTPINQEPQYNVGDRFIWHHYYNSILDVYPNDQEVVITKAPHTTISPSLVWVEFAHIIKAGQRKGSFTINKKELTPITQGETVNHTCTPTRKAVFEQPKITRTEIKGKEDRLDDIQRIAADANIPITRNLALKIDNYYAEAIK